MKKAILSDFRQARLHVASGNGSSTQASQSKFGGSFSYLFEETSNGVFSPLASGKQTIPFLAAVRSGQSPSWSDAEL